MNTTKVDCQWYWRKLNFSFCLTYPFFLEKNCNGSAPGGPLKDFAAPLKWIFPVRSILKKSLNVKNFQKPCLNRENNHFLNYLNN